MYSGTTPTNIWESSESPVWNNCSSTNGPPISDVDNQGNREKGTQRLWDLIGSTLEGGSGARGFKKDVLCNIIKSLGCPLTPVTVAEIILLVGRIIASTRRIDKEQFEATRVALVEAIDSLTTIKWNSVFLAFPNVDRSLKITSIECFAFLVAVFHTKKNADVRFPMEIGLRGKWKSTLSQALFLKWVVVSVAATSTATLYRRMPLLIYLRNVEVPPDTALLEACPPLFASKSPFTALWSNSHLILTLANIAISGTKDASTALDTEQIEAARIAIELLKRPTVNFSDVFLATLVKCVELPLALSRFLASVCVDQLWTMLSSNNDQTITLENFSVYLRNLASLSPSRFGSIVLASLYPRHPDRAEVVVVALQPDIRILSDVLHGPAPPFCFHALHLAKSSSFFPALWLKERLKHDDYESVVKDFISFLTLALCPAKLFQQHQQRVPLEIANNHPLRRLYIGSRDLLLYLYVVAEALCHGRSSNASTNGTQMGYALNALSTDLYSINLSGIAMQSEESVLKDIVKIKQIIAKLIPSLVGVLDIIQPSGAEVELHENNNMRRSDTFSSASPQTTFSNDVDTEVHKQFTALFASQVSCTDMVLSMEQMAKSPPSSFAYKVFDSIVQLLFHECRFFPKYPLSKLAITAEFMGCLIQSGVLLSHSFPLGDSHMFALQCILDSLRTDPHSKSFRFAVTAMEHFLTPRIALCPSFLRELATNFPEVKRHLPAYCEYAEKCLKILPPDYQRSQCVIDLMVLAELPFPPSPQPGLYPEFSLSRLSNTQHADDSHESPIAPMVAAPSSSAGLSPQRPLIIDNRPVALSNFSLGSVEKLLSADPLLNCVKPPQWFCDQAAHALNSLVLSNVHQKANELRVILQPKWHPYFALYIVRSRASKETSFHDAYIKLIEAIGRPKLLDTVVSTTYDCINILLSYCDSAKEFLPYCKVLYNLGSWLGLITLAQNKPLMSRSIDLKNLIFDAYENDRLSVVVPLCCKIIEGVGKSKNFKPPNPWSVAILSLLAEVHSLPGIPNALLFELELLFKNLGLHLTDYKGRTNHLAKHKMAHSEAASQPNAQSKEQSNNRSKPDVSQDEIQIKQRARSGRPSSQTKNSPGHQHASSGQTDPTELSSHALYSSDTQDAGLNHTLTDRGFPLDTTSSILESDAELVCAFAPPFVPSLSEPAKPDSIPHSYQPIKDTDSVESFGKPECALLKTLMKSVVISPSIVLFKIKPILKSVIPQAIENAIREIVQVVAERSVTISCVTAKEVVLKDFSAEVNENLIRRAAQLFVASLAGSIALVTCREPLRAAFNQHIRNSLLAANCKLAKDQRLVDQVVSVTTSDNIELGCALVEEAVVQLSVQKVKDVLHPAFVARQQARQTDGPWIDPVHGNSRWLSLLPPSLQPRPITSGEQLEVYKDFFLLGPLQRMQNSHLHEQRQQPQQELLQQPCVNLYEKDSGALKNDCFLDSNTSCPSESFFASPSADNSNGHDADSVGYLPSFSQRPSTDATTEMQAVMMRVEESLSHIKDMVYEIAFSSPTVKAVPSTLPSKMVTPLGCSLNVVPIPETVNVHLATFAWLPSDHAIFPAIMNTSLCFSFYSDLEAAFANVYKRTIKMINEFAVLYRETPVVIRLSNVAGLYLEVFLALLAYMNTALPHSKTQFDDIIVKWINDIIGIKHFGSAVLLGLLRYQLITLSTFDTVCTNLFMNNPNSSGVEASAVETCLCVLFQVLTQTGIRISSMNDVLRDIKGVCTFLHQYTPDVRGSSTTQSPTTTNASTTVPVDSAKIAASATSEPTTPLPITLKNFISMGIPQMKRVVLHLVNQHLISEQADSGVEAKTEVMSTLLELMDSYVTLGGPSLNIRSLPMPMDLGYTQRDAITFYFQQWTAASSLVDTERRAKAYTAFFQSLAKHQLLNLDEETDVFLTGCVEHVVELVIKDYPTLDPVASQTSAAYASSEDVPIDALPETECSPAVFMPLNLLAKLIVALMRSSDFPHISSLLILQRTLFIIVRCIYRDFSTDISGGYISAYYGILVNLLYEVTQPSKELNQQLLSILVCFSNAFVMISPCECPAFAFCWLELISHPSFLPAILAQVRAWPHFQRLVSRLLRFLYPFHRRMKSTPGILAISKGTLRLLLVLLHDFPEFLCEHHIITEHIPLNSIQLRNLVLSAFPRTTALPDPFIPSLKVDLLPEMHKAPKLYGNYVLLLTKSGITQDLDNFQRTQDVQLMKNIIKKIKLNSEKVIVDLDIHYNVSLINAMLLYLASQFPTEKDSFNPRNPGESSAPVTKVAYSLIENLDPEGRYIILSCITDNLRYPNIHTHYFSCLLLWLFSACASIDMVQEQITRVLLERLIAHRPHPWGLLITFIELMKNSKFNFWACPFIHSVSDVQYLFQSVAQTCLGQRNLLQNEKSNDVSPR